LYVGNDAENAVDIFPLTGPNQKQIGTISTGPGPWGLSVDANNSLYVANSGNGTVTVYPYGSSSPSMTYSKGVHEPLYPLADSAGHVFVSGFSVISNHSRGYVFEYNTGTNIPIARARLGYETDGIAEDGKGNLYAAFRRRTGPSSIAEFGPGLRNARRLRMTIDQPQGLVVDNAGNIVVVESALDRIDVFPPGATTPSVTVSFPGSTPNLAQLTMQNSETTLWLSTEGGDVYSMPYPLTPSTKPTEYERVPIFSNGIAVTH